MTSLKAELATAREDYARACHALDEAHGMLKDARAELAALKQRLAGVSQRWRDCKPNMGVGASHNAGYTAGINDCADALDALLKENSDE